MEGSPVKRSGVKDQKNNYRYERGIIHEVDSVVVVGQDRLQLV